MSLVADLSLNVLPRPQVYVTVLPYVPSNAEGVALATYGTSGQCRTGDNIHVCDHLLLQLVYYSPICCDWNVVNTEYSQNYNEGFKV